MPPPMKLAKIGGGMFAFGVIFCSIIFPPLLRLIVKKTVRLKPGIEMRELWSNLPVPLDFMVYLFNVTNPYEISKGAKPILQEVGPFFYDEYKEKVDLVDRDEDDSVEYSIKNTWYFNPERSNGLTGEEVIVFPHVLILGIVLTTLREKPTAIGIVGKAIDSIFKKPDTVFVTAKARDIIFDGLPVDCTVKDFAGSAVCAILKEQGKDLIPVAENEYKFSLFGPKNGTVLPERVRVLRGMKNYKDVGRVIEFDQKDALTLWTTDECNKFNGTDSTIFPPLIVEGDDIVSFAPEICRSLGARYSHRTKVKGVKTYHYTADLGDMSKNEHEKCFCPTPETCLSKNLYDLTKCIGAPLIGSLPHFLESEEEYLNGVEGLHPDPALHDISMDFEPLTATPLSAHKRMQFNMFLHPVEKLKLMKTFPDVLFPMFWIEEGILLDDKFVKRLKMLSGLIATMGFLKWVTILGGIGFGGAAAYRHFKEKQASKKTNVTKVSAQSANRKPSGQEKEWPPTMNVSTIQNPMPNLDKN